MQQRRFKVNSPAFLLGVGGVTLCGLVYCNRERIRDHYTKGTMGRLDKIWSDYSKSGHSKKEQRDDVLRVKKELFENLCRAVKHRHYSVVHSFLLKSEVKSFFLDDEQFFSEQGESGLTFLHVASISNDSTFIRKILESKAISAEDVNTQDSDGFPPLYHAIDSNSVLAVSTLLEDERVKANLPDKNGYNAVHHAAMLSEVEVLQCIIRFRPNPPSMYEQKSHAGFLATAKTPYDCCVASLSSTRSERVFHFFDQYLNENGPIRKQEIAEDLARVQREEDMKTGGIRA